MKHLLDPRILFLLIVFFSNCQSEATPQIELRYLDGLLTDSFQTIRLISLEEMNQMTADEMNRRSDAIDKEIKSEIEQLEENGLIPEGYEVSYSIGVEDNYLVLQNCNFYIKGTRNRGYKGLRFPPGEM